MQMKKLFRTVLCMSLLGFSSCNISERERACAVAQEFSEEYFRMNIKEAKMYCVQELYPIFDFREGNKFLKDADSDMAEGVNPLVNVLGCDINADKDIACVYVEVRDFIRINYLTQQYVRVPCDTFELSLVRESDNNWKIKNPI